MLYFITPLVKILSATVFLLHIGQYIFATDLAPLLGLKFGMFGPENIYRFFTYALLHTSFPHMIGSLLALITIGSSLERYMGTVRFTFFMISCVVGAAIMYQFIEYIYISRFYTVYINYINNPSPKALEFMVTKCPGLIHSRLYEFLRQFSANPDDQQLLNTSFSIAEELYNLRIGEILVGLSSATFGILIAFALLFPDFSMIILPIPIPIRAKYLAVAYMCYEVYAIYSANSWTVAPHVMRVGGALFGYLYVYFFLERESD